MIIITFCSIFNLCHFFFPRRNKRIKPSIKIASVCQRCRSLKKRCVFLDESRICNRCKFFNVACTRVTSNQGARSDMVGMVRHSTNENLIEIERHETYFCSTAAVVSCSKSVESLLVECVPKLEIHENNRAGLGTVGLNGKSSIDSVDSSHEGVDLSFIYSSGNKTTDNVKMGDSNCSGIRKFFEVSDNSDLSARDVSTRFSMDRNSRATFIVHIVMS